MKRFLFILFSLSIIFLIILYLINYKLNVDKIIKKIENDIGISINLQEKGRWAYYPKLQYQNNISLNHINNNLIIENSKINISRKYKIVSPLIITFVSPSILYKGINFRNSIINTKKSKDYIHVNKFYADVIDGNVNLSAKFHLNKEKKISMKGSFNNISLNRVFKQLNISNWERVGVKVSSSNFLINTKNGSFEEIKENLNGYFDINGSVFFVSTEEERFGAIFLALLANKYANLSKMSKSLNYILEIFADDPADIFGKIKIKNGVASTKNLLFSNQKEKALLTAHLDLKTNIINGKIDFYKDNKIFLITELKGNIEYPKIIIAGDVPIDQKNSQPQDIKEIFEKGIKTIIDNIMNTND